MAIVPGFRLKTEPMLQVMFSRLLLVRPSAKFVDSLIFQQQLSTAEISGQDHVGIGIVDESVARSANAASPPQKAFDGSLVIVSDGEWL